AAALTQTLALFAAAGVLADWGRRSFHPRVGLWAAALWIGTPLVVWLGAMAYVDVLLTLFVIAGFACWHRWRDGDGRSFLILAGLFVGLAAGTKYLGLFFCGALGVLTLGRAIRLRTLAPAVWITVIATVTLAPWYLRIYSDTGNPVFPFYAPLFGESVWTTKHDQLLFETGADGGSEAKTEHLGAGLETLARLPWTAVFDRGQFSNMAPITPWYLVLIPLCAVPMVAGGGRRGRAARRLAACFGFYAFFWLSLEHDLRFLLPGLPLLNLAVLDGLDRLTRRLRGPTASVAVAAALLAPGWLYAGHKMLEKGPLPLTAVARADFLDAQVPGHRAVRWLNLEYGDDYTVMTLFAGRLRHYARGRLYGDAWGPDGHRIIRRALHRGHLPDEL
ncbi:MAG: phospholipid carrier-dependent glycosyltransferase, partial [Acidobacteriota bacterium]